jgi:hypothetical protein
MCYRLRIQGPAAGEASAVLHALCRLAYNCGRLRRSLAYHLMAFAARTDSGPFADGNMARLLTTKLPDSARSRSYRFFFGCFVCNIYINIYIIFGVTIYI